ncbi:MAG: hypothetical protein H6828_01275 [Planctomycetes bacterium]|nr:hypothetical protein [Planctomycetota bacterium]
MRTLTTLVLALAAAAPAAQVGDGDALFVYHLAEHLEAVRAERVAELRAAYAEAAPERRSAAEAALLAGVDPGRPALRPPDFDALARARRALLGEAAPAPALDELAESLDLRVVPGCFAARAEGRGEATTVAVTQLWRAPGRDADVTLWWTRGEERERARSEPVAAASFAAGFEMYVRPPVSTPGRWALVAELRAGDASAWSRPVAVECVDDLAALRARVAADASLGAGAAGRAFATRFERLFALGVRSAAGVPSRQLESSRAAARGRSRRMARRCSSSRTRRCAKRRGLLLAATPGQAAVELVDPAWSATGAATERRVRRRARRVAARTGAVARARRGPLRARRARRGDRRRPRRALGCCACRRRARRAHARRRAGARRRRARPGGARPSCRRCASAARRAAPTSSRRATSRRGRRVVARLVSPARHGVGRILAALLVLLTLAARELHVPAAAPGARLETHDAESAWRLHRASLAMSSTRLAQEDRALSFPAARPVTQLPVFDELCALTARLTLGSGEGLPRREDVERVLRGLGPLLTAVTLLGLYAALRRLGGLDAAPALAGLALAAFLPGFVELGVPGHVRIEAAVAPLALLAVALTLPAFRHREPLDRMTQALLGGAATGLGLATSPLFLAVWAALSAGFVHDVVRRSGDERRDAARSGLLFWLPTVLLGQLPALGGPWLPATEGLLHDWTRLLGVLAWIAALPLALGLARAERAWTRRGRAVLWACLALGVGGVLATSHVGPALLGAVRAGSVEPGALRFVGAALGLALLALAWRHEAERGPASSRCSCWARPAARSLRRACGARARAVPARARRRSSPPAVRRGRRCRARRRARARRRDAARGARDDAETADYLPRARGSKSTPAPTAWARPPPCATGPWRWSPRAPCVVARAAPRQAGTACGARARPALLLPCAPPTRPPPWPPPAGARACASWCWDRQRGAAGLR